MSDKKKSTEKMAVVYARYSSHNQGEQSIEGQLTAAKAYAAAKGYTIVHEYIDRAMTGRNDNRYEFQKMLTDCAKGQFQVIIVWKVDRFGRNRQEITFNKYRAKKHGVAVEYVAENLPDSPEGVILESVLEGMAEYYSLQLSQNVQRGFLESAKKKKMLGGNRMLGYLRASDGTYQIDPETAPIVKKIYEDYASGHTTMRSIADDLNQKGITNMKGKPFTAASIRSVLQNEKYTGLYVFKDIIRDENGIPAIIDKELFQKVQEMKHTRQQIPAHDWNTADYLLTGKLFCGHCGSNMSGVNAQNKKKVTYHYYTCLNHKKKEGCKKKPVRKEPLENLVLTEVQKLITNDTLFQFIIDKTWEYYLQTEKQQNEADLIRKQLLDVRNGLQNLVRSIEAGIFNDMIKNRMDELTAQETALKKALADTEIQSGFKLTKDHIQFFLEQFRDMDFTDIKCQKRLIATFVNSIYVFDDHFKIVFNFSGDNNTVTLENLSSLEREGVFAFRAPCPCFLTFSE